MADRSDPPPTPEAIDTLRPPLEPSSGRPDRTARLQRLKRGPGFAGPEGLEDFEGLRVADYLDRLAADRDLILRLELSGFDPATDDWREFARALAEYGYAVYRAWFGTGEITRRLAMRSVRGRTVIPAPFAVDEDTVAELAAELTIRGIRSFRDNVLARGRWDASGGASLKTFFIGHLLFLVPATYRQWRRDHGELDTAWDPSKVPDVGRIGTAIDRVDDRLLLDRILPGLRPAEAVMFELSAAGRTVKEIANQLGTTVPKVKTDMMRARQRLARKHPEVHSWVV